MSPDRAELVIMQGATFRGPNGPVFPDTTWRLAAGERWVVRGASGAGKSLFVAALTGRLPRLTGQLRHPFLEGRRGCADSIYGVLPAKTIAVASMDQHRALVAAREFHQLRWHGSLAAGAATVQAFLSRAEVEGTNPFRVEDDEGAPRFAEAFAREAERFELRPLLTRPLLALSNGELHRVLIARALMLDPHLLVVDDPFAGLDAGTRAVLSDVLLSLPGQGTDVLYVTSREQDVLPAITHELSVVGCAVASAGPRRPPGTSRASARRMPVAAAASRSEQRATDPKGPKPKPASEAPIVELTSVSVRHGAFAVLTDVDWTIRSGERWALVGPNGAGKSTLVSLILADHPQAHANQIVVCGRRLGPGTSIWDIKRHLGWVSPELDAHYPPESTLEEVVASGYHASLGVHARLVERERASSGAWLDRFGLGAMAEHAFGELPSVARRLALLARACVHEPRLLLLDEPCQGLDADDRASFAGALECARARLGAALIYITHDPSELPAGIEQVLRLEAGRVRRGG